MTNYAINIIINDITGKTHIIKLDNNEYYTILDIKDYIFEKIGMEQKKIKLLCHGKLVNDTIMMNETYNNKQFNMVLML